MPRRLFLVLVLLAVPTLAYLAGWAVLWKTEHDWQLELEKQYPAATAEQRTTLSLERLCADPEIRQKLSEVCSAIDNRRLLQRAAVVTGVVGAGWLALIALAGRLTRTNRRLLLHVFRPGLYLTNLVVVVLIAAHGILAVAALYLLESTFINRLHLGVMLIIGIGAFAGVAAVARATFSAVRTATTSVVGRVISRDESPTLWQFVGETAQAAAVQAPDNMVVGLDPNFFVTEVPVHTLSGRLTGRTLYASLPFLRILSSEELRAVIGHELGHYHGRDTAFSRYFYPIYRGTQQSLAGLETAGGEGAGNVALVPAIATLSYFLECFQLAERSISRDRELEADRMGAAVSSPAVLASALVKIHAFTPYWDAITNQVGVVLRDGKAFRNLSELFANLVRESAKPEALTGLGGRHTTHPTDSHPTLEVRLNNLGVPLRQVEAAALELGGGETARSLVPSLEQIESELTDAEHYLLARSLGIGGTADEPGVGA